MRNEKKKTDFAPQHKNLISGMLLRHNLSTGDRNKGGQGTRWMPVRGGFGVQAVTQALFTSDTASSSPGFL